MFITGKKLNVKYCKILTVNGHHLGFAAEGEKLLNSFYALRGNIIGTNEEIITTYLTVLSSPEDRCGVKLGVG